MSIRAHREIKKIGSTGPIWGLNISGAAEAQEVGVSADNHSRFISVLRLHTCELAATAMDLWNVFVACAHLLLVMPACPRCLPPQKIPGC